jgi:hypothetical protein
VRQVERVAVARDPSAQIQVLYMPWGGAEWMPKRAIGVPGAWRYDGSMPNFSGGSSIPSSATPAIAFGSNGQIHLVYGGYGVGVVYAYFDGCTWTKQVLDSDVMQGGNASIALDSAGHPHIAYGAAIDPVTETPLAGPLTYVRPAP